MTVHQKAAQTDAADSAERATHLGDPFPPELMEEIEELIREAKEAGDDLLPKYTVEQLMLDPAPCERPGGDPSIIYWTPNPR